MIEAIKRMWGGETKREGTDLGETAVLLGFITRAQAHEARAYQSAKCPANRMGNVLLDLGMLTSTQLAAVLDRQRALRSSPARGANAALDTLESVIARDGKAIARLMTPSSKGSP